MKKVLLSIFLVSVSICSAQSGYIHGNGDPRTITPTPNCGASRFFIDDSTGNLYIASQGSPCVWTVGGGGGASLTFTAPLVNTAGTVSLGQAYPSNIPVTGVYNCYFFGDSNTAGLGVASQSNAMAYLITADTGCNPGFVGGYSGFFAEYIAAHLLANYPIPPSASLDSAYRQPLVVLAAGTNNGYFCINSTGPTAGCLNNYQLAMSAMEAWVTIPTASKIMASAGTASGTWAVDAAAPLSSTVTGTTEKSTTIGNTLTFTVPNSGPKIGVTRIARDANLGTFTISIDGTLQTSLCTGTTTFQNYGCSTANLNVDGTEVNAPQREEFSVTPGVSHTVVIAVTSPTLSTNVVSILDVDTTPAVGTIVGPVMMVSGVPQPQSNSGTYFPTALTSVDTTDAAITATGIADGMNLHFVNVRTPITFTNGAVSPAINTGADMEGNNTALCPGNGANGLHMNVCGQFHWTQSIEATALGQGVGFAYVSQGSHAAYSPNGFSSLASIWQLNVAMSPKTQQFSTTAAMVAGVNFFGIAGDGFLAQVGHEYDPTHAKYAISLNYGTGTEVTWKTCTTGYTLVSACTLRAWIDGAGNYTANGYISSVLAPSQTVGAAIASAATIAPTAGLAHVTGTAAIVTITAPAGYTSTVGGCITLIADGAWTTTTAGNVFAAITAVPGTGYKACYDGSKWYIN